MLNLKKIRSEPELVKKNLLRRGFDVTIIDRLLLLLNERGVCSSRMDKDRARRNELAKLYGRLKREEGDEHRTSQMEEESRQLGSVIRDAEERLSVLNRLIDEIVLNIPNLVADSVIDGQDESDNVVIEEHATLGAGKISGKSHSEILSALDLLQNESAAKISGARFVIYKDKLSRLIRALVNYFIDFNVARGYTELNVPHLVRGDILTGTGQLPKFKEDLFKIEDNDLWLIPTGEVPLTNLFYNEIIDLSSPRRFTTHTKCYRAEAGSGGRDVRGLIRLHEFHKVELVKIVEQERGEEEFEAMAEDVRALLQSLEIPFRRVMLCSGDLGFTAMKTYDFEIWMPSENRYREISSVSICGDFQARRAKIRYRDHEGVINYAITMNGSSLAIDRCVAAIIENGHAEDGQIRIPKCLTRYYGRDYL